MSTDRERGARDMLKLVKKFVIMLIKIKSKGVLKLVKRLLIVGIAVGALYMSFKSGLVKFLTGNTASAKSGTVAATEATTLSEQDDTSVAETETVSEGITKYLGEAQTDLSIQICVKNENAYDAQEDAHVINNIQVEVSGNKDFEIILGDSVLKDTYDGYDAYVGVMKKTKVTTNFMEKFDGSLKITTAEEEKIMPGQFLMNAKEMVITYVFTPKIDGDSTALSETEVSTEAPTTVAVTTVSQTAEETVSTKVVENTAGVINNYYMVTEATESSTAEPVTTATAGAVEQKTSLKVLGIPIYEAQNIVQPTTQETQAEAKAAEAETQGLQAIDGFGTAQSETAYPTQFPTAGQNETLDEHGQDMLDGVLADLKKGN